MMDYQDRLRMVQRILARHHPVLNDLATMLEDLESDNASALREMADDLCTAMNLVEDLMTP